MDGGRAARRRGRSARCCSRRSARSSARFSAAGCGSCRCARSTRWAGCCSARRAGFAVVWVARRGGAARARARPCCAGRRRPPTSPPADRARAAAAGAERARADRPVPVRSPARSASVQPPTKAILRSRSSGSARRERRARRRHRVRGGRRAAAAGVAAPHLVVTAAHVVAGEHDTRVEQARSSEALPATWSPSTRATTSPSCACRRCPPRRCGSPTRVPALPSRSSATRRTARSTRARADRAARGPSSPRTRYGRGPVDAGAHRLRRLVRHGDSGGPAVDGDGAVQTTIFAARDRRPRRLRRPDRPRARALAARRHDPVSTGACAPLARG